MKSSSGLDGSYVNEGIDCSTLELNMTLGNGDSHNGIDKGSNEFILSTAKSSPTEKLEKLENWMQQKAKSVFTQKMLHKRLPILNWLPKYNSQDAIGDLVAGLTVGLTVIPQALAYSNMAGLPAAYGLYGSFLGSIVYIFLGSCKDVPMGPTAIAALLTFNTVAGNWQKAVLLCFLAGFTELLMGIFGLGFLVDFVSGPVSSGFTSAVALIIVTSQIKDIFGITANGATFLEIWRSIFKDISNIQSWDTALGVTCIAVLLSMRIVATLKVGPKDDSLKTKTHNFINKMFWLIGTARNAILVVICGIIGYSFKMSGDIPFKTIGYIPPGLPSFQLPPFSLTANETLSGKEESFIQIVSSMGSGLIVVPLISLMENIAICKAFGKGKPIDASQELIAIGVANIANSFVSGFPGTGSLSRSAVNNASGVRTPLGNIYTGALVIVSLLFFTPYFAFIPKSTLGAIIIAAVVFMVEVNVLKPIWRTKKSDLVPGLGTFICCLLFPLEIGILIGVGLNIMFILYHAARPKISVETLLTKQGIEYLLITPDRCLIFPSVDYVRNLVTKHSIKKSLPVTIDCSYIYYADYTAATVIESITNDFVKRNQPLFFFNLKPSVCAVFEGLSPADFVVYYREEELDELLREKAYKPTQIMPA